LGLFNTMPANHLLARKDSPLPTALVHT
jgi:hypothetical protein